MNKIIKKIKKFIRNRQLILTLNRQLILTLIGISYFFFPILIFFRFPIIRGTINLYMLTFLVWIFEIFLNKFKSKIILVALVLLLFLPILLIFQKDTFITDDLSVYVFELLVLGVFQEIFLIAKKKITNG